MKDDLQLLACGNSSVGGFKWYFIGVDHAEMAVVTSEQCYSDDDPKAWTVRSYSPGRKQDEWKHITGPRAQRIVDACRAQTCDRHIDWTNETAIRDLYWEYKQ